MGQVIVRKLDAEVIEIHRRRAKARGRSLEQELREVITSAAGRTKEERLRRAREIRAMMPELPPGQARNPRRS